MYANVWILSISISFMSAAYFTWAPLLPLHLRNLGATDFQVGLTYATMTLSLALFQFYGGRLADRFGRKLLIALPTFAFAPLNLLLALSRDWTAALAVLAAMNAMTSLQIPGFIALTGESVPANQKGKAFAILNFFWGVGIAAGPGIGALLLPTLGVRGLMLLAAAMALMMGTVRIWLVKEPARTEATEPVSLRMILQERQIYPALALLSLVAVIFSLTIMGPFVPLYARDVLKLGERGINLLYSIGAFAALTGPVLGGFVIDRYTARAGLGLGLAGHLSLLLLWMIPINPLAAILFFTGSYISLQLAWTAYDTYLADVTTATGRGSVVGLIGTLTTSVGAGGPPVAGLLKDAWGPGAPFWLAAVLGILVLLGLRALPTGVVLKRAAGPEAKP